MIEQEQTASVPFEDIAVIVLDHPDISLTHGMLATCADHGISLFATGDNHLPNGIFLPFLQHSRSTRLWRLQQESPRPLVKQTWAALVRRKIENQAACLQLAECTGADRLSSYARRVRSGDPDRLEGLAAAFYFRQLFGRQFDREQQVWVNAALNYGYAVLRGVLARALVAHGLHPSIGLFHSSEQNAFNLVDDLIEPFRPLIDLHVEHVRTDDEKRGLSPPDKAGLVALLNTDLAMPRGIMNAFTAMDQTVESLARVMETNDVEGLELPTIVGLRPHRVDGS
jgi:CRISPR-associated protein Cas1